MINTEDFNSNLLETDRKSYKNIGFYYIGYITIKNIRDYKMIHSLNPLYLIIGEADGYIEQKNENKYLIFYSTDKNKKVLKKYTKLWYEIKYLIKIINSGESRNYEKEYTKKKFISDDNLPLNKILKLSMFMVIVKYVFEENGKYYSQVFLDECLYRL